MLFRSDDNTCTGNTDQNTCNTEDNSWNPKDELGYDGQFILDYENICLSFISQYVRDKIFTEHDKFISDFLGRYDGNTEEDNLDEYDEEDMD